MEKELEVKVLNIDIESMEKRILKLGGKIISREKQINTLIDATAKPIKSYLDAYLRIREVNDELNNRNYTILTLKKNIGNANLRENQEYSVSIENKEILLKILTELGFDKISVGYKERISYDFMGARIDLDRWDRETYPKPYMEIEVNSESELARIIEVLEISTKNISRLSIVELQELLSKPEEE